jgi:hypothetical protein
VIHVEARTPARESVVILDEADVILDEEDVLLAGSRTPA